MELTALSSKPMMTKVISLVVPLVLGLATPVLAVDYQGVSLDGKKLPAKVYSYDTGGLYEAQVEFKRDLATVYFASGSQLVVRLNQKTITDLDNILAYGRLGQIPINRWLGVGVRSDNGLTGGLTVGAGQLKDLWRISLTNQHLTD